MDVDARFRPIVKLLRGHPRLILLPIVCIFLVQVLSLYRGSLSIYDDAYITFRYSRNLVEGVGPVFNPGEAVEGYTNFVWMALLAAAHFRGLSLERVSILLGISSGVALPYATWILARRAGLRRWLAYAPPLMMAGTVAVARYAVSGMEMILFTTLVIFGTALAVSHDRSLRATFYASLVLLLASMTRPEGMLFAVGGLVARVSSRHDGESGGRRDRERMDLAVFVMPWLVIYMPYFMWRFLFYGYPLPNTFYAKVGAGNPTVFLRGVKYLLLMLPLVNPQLSLPLLALPWIKFTRARRLITVLAASYLAYLVYIGGDDYSIFGPRLLLPIFPFLAVLGIAALRDLLSRIRPGRRRAVGLGTASFLALLMVFHPQPERDAYIGVMETMNRGWRSAANWLLRRAPRGSTIAVDSSGIIPYQTGLATIDMYGLTDEHIAHSPVATMGEGLAGHEKTDPLYVINRNPDYVSVWIDPNGSPVAAGLERYGETFLDLYSLCAVVLMRVPSPDEEAVLPGSDFDSERHAQGYIYGIYGRSKPDGEGVLCWPHEEHHRPDQGARGEVPNGGRFQALLPSDEPRMARNLIH